MIVNFTPEPESTYLISPERVSLDRVAVIILGGGEGKRLSPLTKSRCKPAISFGGRYTLIDVPISHSLTTGLKKIYIIGQYLVSSLQKHLYQTYYPLGLVQDQIQLLAPEERDGKKIWFKGTADAVRQNLQYFSQISADYFLILSGDQLYNINFQEMIQFGVEQNAGMVIASQPVTEKEAKRMGLLKVAHGDSRIIDFYEKPQEKEILDQYATDDLTLHSMGYDPESGKRYLASMGIYFFKRESLFSLLEEDHREDFGKHLIKTQMKKGDVHAYLYDGYWEDIGTIESYYHANLALTRHNDDTKHGLQCYDERNAIMTKSYRLPGAKVSGTLVKDSLICEGSLVEGEEVTHSVLGVRSVVKKGTVIRDSILLGNEYYASPLDDSRPSIGHNCLIVKAIIDENVIIGNHVKLVNAAGHVEFDHPEGILFVRDGIIVIPRGAKIPHNFTF